MDYREMHELFQDPSRVQAEARLVLSKLENGLDEKSRKFLYFLEEYDGSNPITSKQKEYFYDLYQQSSSRTHAGGYYSRDLIKKAYYGLVELPDDQYDNWITRLYESERDALMRYEWKMLLHICRKIGLEIPKWIDLDS